MAVGISAQEQLMLELVNGARLDPNAAAAREGVSLNDGLAAGTISATAKAPLTWNMDLVEAAEGHAVWISRHDTKSDIGAKGSTPFMRMIDAGFTMTMDTTAVFYGNAIYSLDGKVDLTELTENMFQGWIGAVPSMRASMLGDWNQIGAGIAKGPYTDWGRSNPAMFYDHHIVKVPAFASLTGVAFQDRDGDRFYDVGGGLGGVTFDRLSDGKAAVTSMAAGCYSVTVRPLSRASARWRSSTAPPPCGCRSSSTRAASSSTTWAAGRSPPRPT